MIKRISIFALMLLWPFSVLADEGNNERISWNDGEEILSPMRDAARLQNSGTPETKDFVNWVLTKKGSQQEFLILSITINKSMDITGIIFSGCALLDSETIDKISSLKSLRKLVGAKLDVCTKEDILKIASLSALSEIIIVTFPNIPDKNNALDLLRTKNPKLKITAAN
jgi:hypothetical protein